MKAEVVIVGGGPGGTTAAMYLIREGIKPIIIEKDVFPRYHVGESMTGECGAILRDLGLEEVMLKHQHPIKHGVKVYGTNSWFIPVMQRTEEGQLKDQFTWQVRRSDFDKMMLDEAVARGATLVSGQAYKAILGDDGSVRGVQVRLADGGMMDIESEVVLDCSGQNTWLANQGGITGPKYLGNYDRQLAIFSQIVGGIRDDGGTQKENQPDNTIIFYKKKYHWGWWIPIDDQAVSVGIVSPAAYFLEQEESKKEFITRELRELHPELSCRIPEINLIEDVRAIRNYSYQVKNFCGKGFICIGDAHRFVDPIFSFGLYVTMKEAQYAAPAVRAYLEGHNRDKPNPFAEYQMFCERGSDILEDVTDGFWEHPFAFAFFVHSRYREDMVDIFAGRIYENKPVRGVEAFRKLLDRERSYDNEDLYSIPIGSRYNPERASIWEETPSDQGQLEKILSAWDNNQW